MKLEPRKIDLNTELVNGTNMDYKERIKLVVKEWFYYKTSITVNDDNLNVLVDRIAECKQCDIPVVVRSAFLVQHKDTLINHGLFDNEDKAKKYTNGCDGYAIKEVQIA